MLQWLVVRVYAKMMTMKVVVKFLDSEYDHKSFLIQVRVVFSVFVRQIRWAFLFSDPFSN